MQVQDKEALLKEIYEASFGIDDAVLYLDTHPDDTEALTFYHNCLNKREQAKKVYETQYEPLTVKDTARDNANGWAWSTTAMPWEGGNCPCGITKNGYSSL